MNNEKVLKQLRIFLLGFSIFVFAGAMVELIALKHYGEEAQFVPLVLCPLGIVLAALFLAKPGRKMLKAMQVGMWIIAAGGVVGTFIHVSGNLEQVFEGGRSVNLVNLFYLAAGGRNPLLAPGILTIGAALALAAAYKHPVLEAVKAKK